MTMTRSGKFWLVLSILIALLVGYIAQAVWGWGAAVAGAVLGFIATINIGSLCIISGRSRQDEEDMWGEFYRGAS
jgi:hypothetical protein